MRIGLAGGGTDVSPYSDLYGGAILNATVSLYASASIELLEQPRIILHAIDRQEQQEFKLDDSTLPIDGKLDLLKGVFNRIKKDFGFAQKRQMAEGISNNLMDEIYDEAKKAGATGGKISGAGGGGFMIFYCPGTAKYQVMYALQKFGGHAKPYQFVDHGLTTWTI